MKPPCGRVFWPASTENHVQFSGVGRFLTMMEQPTQKYRVLSRNISEYSLLTHRRIEGSGSYSRMIRVSTATDDSFQVGFVTGRAGNFLRTIEEELLGVEAIA